MQDIETILHKMESMGLIRLNRPIGEYYSVYCPLPHNGHYETRPSCGVLLHDQYKNGKLTKAGWTHCFRGDTLVLTDRGAIPIAELCDLPTIKIINGNGDWEATTFKNYGKSRLWKIELCRDQVHKIIYATKDHEWFIDAQPGLYTTETLPVGRYLQSVYVQDAGGCPEARWEILSVEPTDLYEDVYCCETSTHSFVLDGNILTHNCFSCGLAKSLPDTITEILKYKNISKSGLDWLKENIPDFDEESAEFDYLLPQELSNSLQNRYALDYINSKIISESPNFVTEKELASYRMTVPYMYQRGLTDEIIEKYDIGYDANFIPPGRKKPMPCVTFPVKDSKGNTLFLCRRSIEGKFFHYPQGVEKSLYGMYELSPGTKSVVVVESCFNCLSAVRYGYPAVALLGTGTSYEINQLKQLGVQEFVLCLDGDEAGQRGMEKLKRALRSVAIVWTIKMPPDKDVNDCTKEEFDALYATRE